MKILIVDDKKENLYLLEALLQANGYETVKAENGGEALEKLRQGSFDLIISDILMPKMDGFQFCRECKKDDIFKKIPFIFYTSTYTDEKDEELALRLGADKFIVKPFEHSKFMEIIRQVLAEAQEGRLAVRGGTIEEETAYLKLYSERLIHKLETKLTQLQETNLGLEKEIAGRKIVEEALKASETKYRALFEESKDVIFIATQDGTLLDINKAGIELFGYDSLKDMIKINLDKNAYWNPEDRRKLQILYETQGFVKDYEIDMKRKAGEKITVLVTATAVKGEDGRIFQYRGMLKDITIQKKLEEQLRQSQKMEAIGQLAGGIAHDFNNILTAVIGYAHILKMKIRADEHLKGYAENILILSDKAANLTQGLLAFSRKQQTNPCPVRINDLAGNTLKLLSRIISENIRLQTVFSEKEPVIMADHGQIEQVLINLVTNARDAMPQGGLLSVSTEEFVIDSEFIKEHGFGKEGQYALITVSDTGAGMDKNTRERIFEPFFTTKEAGKGTGLGLAIVYGVIKQHKGYINVYSEIGKGTAFRIFLPLIQTDIGEIKPETIEPVEKGIETLLLAEDEVEVREFIKKLLKENGYSVITAATGQEAINEFKAYKNKISLALLDMIMPNKNGEEVYKEIKQMKPDIKALFMSGYPLEAVNKHGIIDETVAFIEKPASPTKLLKKIREVLDRTY